jgi:hypothetical protein
MSIAHVPGSREKSQLSSTFLPRKPRLGLERGGHREAESLAWLT